MGLELKVLLVIKKKIRLPHNLSTKVNSTALTIVINHFISNATQRSWLEYSSDKYCISYLKNEVRSKSFTCYKEEYQASTHVDDSDSLELIRVPR